MTTKMAIRDLKAVVANVNIRGCEQKQGKNGDYLLVRFEDTTGKPLEMVDRDVTRKDYYKRDTQGSLVINIDVGKYTNLTIVDFVIDKG